MSHNCNTRYGKLHFGNTDYFLDSSRKRYWRAHGDTTIFNFNYGSSYGGHCCGGHKSLGFWGGFGLGLGQAAMGLLGNVGGWLGFGGGFGGFGNFGGGFGNFGFGNWSNPWSVGNNGNNNSKVDNKKSEKSEKSEKTEKNCNCGKDCKCADDVDSAKLNKLHDEANELNTAARDIDLADKDAVDAHNKKVQELLEKLDNYKLEDEIITDANKEFIENIKKGLKNTEVTYTPKTDSKEEINPTDDTMSINERLSAQDKKTLEEIGAEVITIKDKEMLTLPNEKNLTVNALKKLAAISDKYNIAVAVANNTAAGEDEWIAGKIENINDDNGKISYTVDCNGYGQYGYKYTVEQNEDDNKWTIDLHKDSIGQAQEDGRGHKAQVDYEYKGGKLVKDGESVVSKNHLKQQQ